MLVRLIITLIFYFSKLKLTKFELITDLLKSNILNDIWMFHKKY